MQWLYGLVIGLMWCTCSVITYLTLRYNWKQTPAWLFAVLAIAVPPLVFVLQFSQR